MNELLKSSLELAVFAHFLSPPEISSFKETTMLKYFSLPAMTEGIEIQPVAGSKVSTAKVSDMRGRLAMTNKLAVLNDLLPMDIACSIHV